MKYLWGSHSDFKILFILGDDYDLCAICLEDYKVGEKLRLLPCQHGKLSFFVEFGG